MLVVADYHSDIKWSSLWLRAVSHLNGDGLLSKVLLMAHRAQSWCTGQQTPLPHATFTVDALVLTLSVLTYWQH